MATRVRFPKKIGAVRGRNVMLHIELDRKNTKATVITAAI